MIERNQFMNFTALVFLLGIALIFTGAETRTQLNFRDIPNKGQIIGALGKPLGESILIEGIGSAREGIFGNPMEVDIVSGQKVENPVLIDVRGNTSQLEVGKRYKFRGHENGSMAGLGNGDGELQQKPIRFAVWFDVDYPKRKTMLGENQ